MLTQESNSHRIAQKVAAFFLQHKGKGYSTRVIASAIGEERRITSFAARHLFSLSFLTRRKARGGGELLYSLFSDGKTKEDTPVEEIYLKENQIKILVYVQNRRGRVFTCPEISEELAIEQKIVSDALLPMVRYGLLKCSATSIPMSYSIADEKRIAAVLEKKKEKPPLSPFWQSMAIWDSAVRSAICHKMH